LGRLLQRDTEPSRDLFHADNYFDFADGELTPIRNVVYASYVGFEAHWRLAGGRLP